MISKKYVLMISWSIASVLFFGYLNFAGPRDVNETPFFNSPDEALNFWAAKKISHFQKPLLLIPDEFADYKFIDPRATFLAAKNIIASTSFLGFPIIAGAASAALRSEGAIVWITPLAAALLCWTLYFFSRIFFEESASLARTANGEQIATASFFLLTFFSPILYYAERGMFHNLIFVFFWASGMFFLYKFAEMQKNLEHWDVRSVQYLLCGTLFLVLAIFTRTIEAMWIVPGAIFFVACSGACRRTATRSAALLLAAAIVLIFSAPASIIIGNVLRGLPAFGFMAQGYNTGTPGATGGVVRAFFLFLFPFGINLRNILSNAYQVFFVNLWWCAAPAFFGLALLIKNAKKLSSSGRVLTISLGIQFLWLIIVYGSWRTFDTPGFETLVTIGNAHMRYWLPILIFLPLLAAYFFVQFFTRGAAEANNRPRKLLLAAYFAFFVWRSLLNSWSGVDGIPGVLFSLNGGAELVRELDAAHADFVIADREDKFLFGRYFLSRRIDKEKISSMLKNKIRVYEIKQQ